MAYIKTVYVNDSTPPISAENLNKQENELEYLDSFTGRSDEFFGVCFLLEQGGLDTNTGAEVTNVNSTRSNFLSLKSGDTISQGGLFVWLLKYNSTSSYNGLVTSGRSDITIASDGLYRLLIGTGTVSDVYDSLKIIRQSNNKTLQELSDETSFQMLDCLRAILFPKDNSLNQLLFIRGVLPRLLQIKLKFGAILTEHWIC